MTCLLLYALFLVVFDYADNKVQDIDYEKMEEIAENNQVSKNAVSKTIIEVKDKLSEYENQLHLLSNKNKIENILSKDDFESIKDYV